MSLPIILGAASDEIADPRIYAELIRQWSTDHPRIPILPRKFKVAVTGAKQDARLFTPMISVCKLLNKTADWAWVIIGGGLGRTPMIGKVIREFVAMDDILPYLESVSVSGTCWVVATTNIRRGLRLRSMKTVLTNFRALSMNALP